MISCLTISTASRWPLLRQAIVDFSRQTFADRELVIVYEGDRAFSSHLEQEIASYSSLLRVRLHPAPPEQTLGALRNLSVSLAEGELVCQWDDDDRHHPLRLQRQMDALAGEAADACFLVDQMHLFMATQEIFWEDWDREPYPMNLIPGTLLAKKLQLPQYPDEPRGEDSALISGLLRDERRIARLRGAGWLVIYRYHGDNAWDYAHHRAITRAKHVRAARILSHESALRNRLSEFDPPLGPMTMPHEAGQLRFE